jgi:type II secretory pathway pseudopilin PulG
MSSATAKSVCSVVRPSGLRIGLRRRAQQGMVLIIVVALVLLGGVLFVLSTVKVTAVSVERNRATNEALAKAKDALIAYAVSHGARPGSLPCPDANDDGEAKSAEDYDAATGACNSLIGRLPWKTLGLADLRDDAGERLWYAVSGDFREGNALALNSDTAYRAANVSLTLAGTTPASNLAALVFSPGAVLKRSDGVQQTRGCTVGINCDASFKCTSVPASNTPKCNPANFLDLDTGEDNADTVNRTFIAAARSTTFNDRLLPIFSDDIMRLVERRAARELAQHLRDHYDAWQNAASVVSATAKGFYPYAVPWNDPSAAAQVGTNNTTSGMLPLSSTPLTWSNATPIFCNGNGTATLDCNAVVICILGVCVPSFSARIDNVGTRFADPPTAANVQVLLGVALGGGATWTMDKPNRRLNFTYGGLVAAGNIQIRVSAPAASGWLGTSWLTANNWHQTAYYGFASGYGFDSVNKTCGGAAPACLTIANTAAPNNDKQAVVVMTGRSLTAAGQTQRPIAPPPPAVPLAEFFEATNADGASPFEANARTASFNDTPIAVRP